MSTFAVQEAWDDDVLTLRQLLAEAEPEALPAWLESRRWFSDKGRAIASVRVAAILPGRANGDLLALALAAVTFTDGGRALYFVPLALTEQPDVADSILRHRATLVDATAVSAFAPWLLGLISASATSGDGRWVFSSDPAALPLLESALAQPPTVLRGEQSNTSIRFGDAVILKLVRRLQPAPNPEEEILRGLTRSGFGGVPAFVGGVAWSDDDGTSYPLALAQAMVPNDGDGWTWMLHRLHQLVTAPDGEVPGGFAAERLLGQRTAELHVALSQVPGADFAPALPESAAIDADRRRSADAATLAIELLRQQAGALSESVRADLPRIAAGLREAAARSEGFAAETGVPRIRVHGDYHLGQTLRTADDDWAIIDFEGEPARPVSERRQKSSALKDVAGMLRSFAYARGAAERTLADPREPTAKRHLRAWEQGAREAFLQGYVDTIKSAPMPLVPADETDFQRALAAWEIDKALYEIAYEARNRPDWIEIPLLTLIPETEAGSG